MRHAITAVLVGCLSLLMESTASADWDEGDIAKLSAMLKAGNGFIDSGDVDSKQRQLIFFYVGSESGRVFGYVVDFKARSCFVFGLGIEMVPCRLVKAGYPLFAPLIAWDKDGWVE